MRRLTPDRGPGIVERESHGGGFGSGQEGAAVSHPVNSEPHDNPTSVNGDRYIVGSTWITRRMLVVAGLALVLIASMVYTVRGPLRAYESQRDFTHFYTASKAWLIGQNPYDVEAQTALFLRISEGVPNVDREQPLSSLYPPTTFVVMAPVAALPLRPALLAWVGVNTLLVVIGLLALLRVARLEPTNPRGLLLLSLFLVMGPVHSAVTYGHVTLGVLAGLALAYLALRADRRWLAGVLIGLATAAKPQLAGLFIVGLFVIGYWRTAAWASGVVLVILGISVARMAVAGVGDWFATWMDNLAWFTQPGGPADATPSGELRWQLVNLAPVVHSFTDSGLVAKSVSVGSVIVVIGLLGWIWRRAPARASMIGVWSILATLTLLPVYHRYYDTCFLILPMVWCVRELRGPMHRWALVCLALMAVFIVPSSTMVDLLGRHRLISPELVHTFFWQSFVKLHQNYLLIALMVLLVYGLARQAQLAAARGRDRADSAFTPGPIGRSAAQ